MFSILPCLRKLVLTIMTDRRNPQGFREGDWQEGQLQDLELGELRHTSKPQRRAKMVEGRWDMTRARWIAT
jgi:hypothetical protein